MNLSQALNSIKPPCQKSMEETHRQLDRILKPLDSLGQLESHLIKISGMTGSSYFDFSKKAVVVFCADNGVVEQGISQTGKEVTALVAKNLTLGQACVCHMARVAGADVIPVDIGIDSDQNIPGVLNRRIAKGTKDFTRQPAMTRQEATAALEAGIELAVELKEKGYRLLATGEMGIGNTTTSSALAAVLLGLPIRQVTGRGAGLSDEGLARKMKVIEQGIALHSPDPEDPLGLLSALGGFDIAGMAGLCIGCAVIGLPVVLDGLISCVSALLAVKLNPLIRHYLLPSHLSAEPAGAMLLERLELRPLLSAGMKVGEGTGAVATFPLYDMICSIYCNMPRFDDTTITPYQRYPALAEH
ncbi:MAG: nicotinate-nucleotide--dimethylbenzimidazole phosphoribosyltransferase [Oscillospiraceae bacterium]|jgi:nicotinate-nucleotide--dimethylbenzimidazole phosphoribosyltransferase